MIGLGGKVGPWKILLHMVENLGAELQETESLAHVEIFPLHSPVPLVIAVNGGSLHTHSVPLLHGLFSDSVPITICHYLQHTAIVEVLPTLTETGLIRIIYQLQEIGQWLQSITFCTKVDV